MYVSWRAEARSRCTANKTSKGRDLKGSRGGSGGGGDGATGRFTTFKILILCTIF